MYRDRIFHDPDFDLFIGLPIGILLIILLAKWYGGIPDMRGNLTKKTKEGTWDDGAKL